MYDTNKARELQNQLKLSLDVPKYIVQSIYNSVQIYIRLLNVLEHNFKSYSYLNLRAGKNPDKHLNKLEKAIITYAGSQVGVNHLEYEIRHIHEFPYFYVYNQDIKNVAGFTVSIPKTLSGGIKTIIDNIILKNKKEKLFLVTANLAPIFILSKYENIFKYIFWHEFGHSLMYRTKNQQTHKYQTFNFKTLEGLLSYKLQKDELLAEAFMSIMMGLSVDDYFNLILHDGGYGLQSKILEEYYNKNKQDYEKHIKLFTNARETVKPYIPLKYAIKNINVVT